MLDLVVTDVWFTFSISMFQNCLQILLAFTFDRWRGYLLGISRGTVGVNKLKTFLSNISAESGIDVHYTNHSLRATAVTRMYNTGVPEKLIAEKSGHRSLN